MARARRRFVFKPLMRVGAALAVALLGSGCTQLSMRDAKDPQRAGATFRYVGMREGSRSPDYSSIDASVLSTKDKAP